MKNSIIFVSAFSVVSLMMVSCASEPQTTTTATHQTRSATPMVFFRLPTQPGGIGYRDLQSGTAQGGGGRLGVLTTLLESAPLALVPALKDVDRRILGTLTKSARAKTTASI